MCLALQGAYHTIASSVACSIIGPVGANTSQWSNPTNTNLDALAAEQLLLVGL